jgi:hypothetical protein
MMKEYKVRITAYVETSEFVEAENEEQACRLAEQKWTDAYIVYNPDLQEYSDFSEIIGYEPEEVEEDLLHRLVPAVVVPGVRCPAAKRVRDEVAPYDVLAMGARRSMDGCTTCPSPTCKPCGLGRRRSKSP